MRTRRRFLLPFVAACAGLIPALPALADVVVRDAWVRGTVAGQQATGAFMTLQSSAAAKLVGVASPSAKVVELHEMKLDGGVMRMNALRELPLPAGKPVALQPSGYHVMLMSLTRPLHEGDVVPLTLTVEDAAGKRSKIDVQAKVRPLTAVPATTHQH